MSGFLLDTNVVSELVKPVPEKRVLDWVASQSALDLYLSAVTLGELTRGVTRLPASRRRDTLARWIDDDLRPQFQGRILAFDEDVAVIWGGVMGEADRMGRPRAASDAQIAATAIRHDLAVVTRNGADFQAIPVSVVNPWDPA